MVPPISRSFISQVSQIPLVASFISMPGSVIFVISSSDFSCGSFLFSELISNLFLLGMLELRVDWPPLFLISWLVRQAWSLSPHILSCPSLLCSILQETDPCRLSVLGSLCQLVAGGVWSMGGTNGNWMVGGREKPWYFSLSFLESVNASPIASMAAPSWIQPPLDQHTVVPTSTG